MNKLVIGRVVGLLLDVAYGKESLETDFSQLPMSARRHTGPLFSASSLVSGCGVIDDQLQFSQGVHGRQDLTCALRARN